MGYRYLYNSRYADQRTLERVKRLRELGIDIEIVDTSDWSEEKKKEVYFNNLIPVSVTKKKRLRGVVRSHKAGVIMLNSILLTDDNFFAGEELEKKIEELEKSLKR